MRTPTPLAVVFALLLPLAARAQSTTPTPQPAKPYSTLDDDPQFKRLPPEQQELMRKIMANVNKAVEDERNTPPAQNHSGDATTPPKPATPPSGCAALPVKKPKFHIPKAIQDAINKDAKQIGAKTGVAVDPNAPQKTLDDVQKNAPCPPAPGVPAAPAKPANQ